MLVVENQIRMFVIKIEILERKSRMMFHMLRMFQIEIQAFVSEPRIQMGIEIQYRDKIHPLKQHE